MDNEALHRRIMADEREFALLADNRHGKKPYIIAPQCSEKHYHPHVKIVQRMFGERARFEEFAAVTELFFCAKLNAKGLNITHSPCAEIFFERVFLKVCPTIVFCVWPPVLSYFQRIGGAKNQRSFPLTIRGHTAMVAEMPR